MTEREELIKRLRHAATTLRVAPKAADLETVAIILDCAIAALTEPQQPNPQCRATLTNGVWNCDCEFKHPRLCAEWKGE